MPEINLSAGVIEYEDTGGGGPVIVFLHGLAMDSSVWRHVVHELRPDYRCIVPTMPLGAHRRPMRPEADLSPTGVARLISEFLDRLDLREVTLVENDTGRAQTLAGDRPERVGRLVIVSSEAFENYPPGLPGRMLALAVKLPGGLNAFVQPLRFRPPRRIPASYGWMAKRPIPDEIMDRWLRPLLTQRAIRRDLERYLRAVDPRDMLDAAERLPNFDRPALVVWATEDRVMPPAHGRRLATLLPQGRLAEVADSYTLIPEDQPAILARELRAFIQDTPLPRQRGTIGPVLVAPLAAGARS
ncbi:MAG: alpha/beta hydrolase [Chloroflexota bacterium]|nr:alpha/beta hydrolase [Chloroflexota bacterium]